MGLLSVESLPPPSVSTRMLDETVEARCDELGVSSRVQQAAESLSGYISFGLRVPAVVFALLKRLERFAARDGRRVAHASSGARAAVKLLAQACAQHAGQLYDLLPAMVRFGTQSLSDCEDSVRDAFAAALSAAVREHAPRMTAEAARAQLVAPFVSSLGNQSNSRGGALALRAVLRALPAHQLQACEDTVAAALKRHLGAGKPGMTTQPQLRALLLDCVAAMLTASESPEAVEGLAQIAIGCAQAPDWRERLAAVSVLRSVPTLQLPAHMRSQHATTLAKLRYDASSLVRQSINDARAEAGGGEAVSARATFERLALQPPGYGSHATQSPPRMRSRGSEVGGLSPGGAEEGGVNWNAMVMACSAARWAAAGTPGAA
eukprot:scaffold18578_cov127-Isochrysis_galbana.AAC.4